MEPGQCAFDPDMCVWDDAIIHIGVAMRINIVIEDGLMDEAMRAFGHSSKKATVEEGLRRPIQFKRREAILSLAGQVQSTGDLQASREGRGTL